MPTHFDTGEKCDGSKILASVHTFPEQFDIDRKFDGKKTRCKILMPKKYTHTIKIDQFHSIKASKNDLFSSFRVFTRCRFQVLPVIVPFSKSTVFEICRQKNVPFSC